ncbi:hypothetical protein ACQPZQ_43800 [Pseudonocardia sp. CA-142604]|uniref:hypothetical protein n=1 Tax=Pseudonocardia sp. CA-142604 TaxID=3240024 RepID=UPI003D8BCC3F
MSYTGAGDPDGGLQAEPSAHGLGLQHDHGRSVSVSHDCRQLMRYVTHPCDPQLESPLPYVHPLQVAVRPPGS